MQRGVFGGSFDPVHVGHLTVARAAAADLALDLVHLVPASDQPFKSGFHEATPEQRMAMLRLAVIGDGLLVPDDREIRRGGVSYTVDTLRELKREYPTDSLCLLVGADAAADLPTWCEADALRRLARIVVLTRPDVALPDHRPVDRTLVVPAVDVSATEIRERIRRGDSIEGLVPTDVAAYIASHGLYRARD
jgi:nicotinate-nucleotide adenylyltransferase